MMASNSASGSKSPPEEELKGLKERRKSLEEQKAAELRKKKRNRDLNLLSELNKDLDRVQAAITAMYAGQGERTSVRILRMLDKLEKQAAQTHKPKGYSRASGDDAKHLLEELKLVEVDGHERDPIQVPDGQPSSAAFDYASYPNEDAGTPAFIEHHQKQLEAFGVKFGRGGFGAYDLPSERSLYSIATESGRAFDGTVDGCIAPHGLFKTSAGTNSIILYEHKQSDDQKRAYADAHPEMPERPEAGSTGTIKYTAHRPQSITALLGAYAHNEYPLIIDLTDGDVHHLSQVVGDELYVWQNLTPRQAYYKQATVLKSFAGLLSGKKLRFTLEDIPEALQAPVKKARAALRHDLRQQE